MPSAKYALVSMVCGGTAPDTRKPGWPGPERDRLPGFRTGCYALPLLLLVGRTRDDNLAVGLDDDAAHRLLRLAGDEVVLHDAARAERGVQLAGRRVAHHHHLVVAALGDEARRVDAVGRVEGHGPEAVMVRLGDRRHLRDLRAVRAHRDDGQHAIVILSATGAVTRRRHPVAVRRLR